MPATTIRLFCDATGAIPMIDCWLRSKLGTKMHTQSASMPYSSLSSLDMNCGGL